MAHGFLKSFDERLEVASAGTEASGKLNRKAVEVMKGIHSKRILPGARRNQKGILQTL